MFRKVWCDERRTHAINNIISGIKGIRKDIQERLLVHFYKIDEELGRRVGDGICHTYKPIAKL
jgi:catalase